MQAKVCNYFVTSRCNDTCEFCPIWQDDNFKKLEESPFDLNILKSLGVGTINFTGGEPLLRDDLAQLLKQARELGLKTVLTTNGIIYAEKAKTLEGLIDRLYFSLDYPIAEEHDRSRGVECFHLVIRAIKLARELKQRPIIMYTMTRDSIRFLPEMVDLAGRLKVQIYLNPVYDYSGTQGFELATLQHIRYYGRSKHVLFNQAVLEFVKNGGNRAVLPRCRAKETTITILPDGQQVKPCFFNRAGQQGREDVCFACLRWDYMLPSFLVGFDKYYWLNLLSRSREKLKGGLK